MEPLSTQSAKTSMLALLALWPAVTSAWLATPIPQWRRDHSITDLIQGNGPIEAWRRDNERCIEYSDHTVIETNSDALKNTIVIYPATFKCREAGAGITIAAIFTRQGEAESFSGLIGDVLVTDTGTGTDGRILTLYSISKKSNLPTFLIILIPSNSQIEPSCSSGFPLNEQQRRPAANTANGALWGLVQ